MVINLINRKVEWIKNMNDQDNSIDIHPEHYKNKIIKQYKSIESGVHLSQYYF